MANCKEETKLNEANNFFNLLKGKTQNKIHQILGEAIGELSGFWGDIYHLDNDLIMIVYYRETEQIKIINKEEFSYIK